MCVSLNITSHYHDEQQTQKDHWNRCLENVWQNCVSLCDRNLTKLDVKELTLTPKRMYIQIHAISITSKVKEMTKFPLRPRTRQGHSLQPFNSTLGILSKAFRQEKETQESKLEREKSNYPCLLVAWFLYIKFTESSNKEQLELRNRFSEGYKICRHHQSVGWTDNSKEQCHSLQ